MKICFPILDDNGLQSAVNPHFGASKLFMEVDSDNETFEVVNNDNPHEAHGQCLSVGSLANRNIDAIVVGGIGARAIQKFASLGIKVYNAGHDTVEGNLKLLKNGGLQEYNMEQSCSGHGVAH